MPITPFHFGPGALIASSNPRYVSFLAFCAINVLIDIESLYNMVTGQPQVHAFFHTYIGATLAAFISVVLFIPARSIARQLPDWPVLDWKSLGVLPVAIGLALGAWSHVALDSLMHVDITPLAPLSDKNPLYGAVSLSRLHWACAACAVTAIAIVAARPRKPVNRRRGTR